ncbi:MAG TPA: uroporphyrinogen-III synthase [Chloroflexota bacterium]|nr:uroporphyrinogen-III synthase [Chloroflexota bacterium]
MPSLVGKIVGITEERRAVELARIVENLGGVPIVAPTISVEDNVDLDELTALRQHLSTGQLDWLVFQTGIGVRRLIAAVGADEAPDLIAQLGRCQLAVRGPKPRQALAEVGLSIHLAPPEATTASLIISLAEVPLVGRHVAVQRIGDDNDVLVDALRNQGAEVMEVTLYRYGPPPNLDKVRALIDRTLDGHLDALTFTSSPAVRGFFQSAESADQARSLVSALASQVVVAAVGPATAAALAALGIPARVMPPRFTMGAMIVELARALEGAPALQEV